MKILCLNIIATLLVVFFCANCSMAKEYTKQDTLRGSIGEGRKWWDVLEYKLLVEPIITTKSIVGQMQINFKLNNKGYTGADMQIDLQQPLIIDSMFITNEFNARVKLQFERIENVAFVKGFKNLNQLYNELFIYYHGKPVIAKNAPWDGGLIWDTDDKNRPWVTVACQELGASAWYPCKDHQSDEPQNGATMTIIHDPTLVAVGNGKMIEKKVKEDVVYTTWQVKSPINNYNFVFYLGNYVPIKQNYKGLNGELDCTFWTLDYNEQKGKEKFVDIHKTLQVFEKWFGAYPWYVDGYQLVEAPHLGMEHQSAVAYGNKYKKGYLGHDLSGTGLGKKWDYIIIHETGHEWWGNHITTNDIADMWIHEGFTTYSESLFVEEFYNDKAKGEAYAIGMRKNISNSEPIIGEYGINKQPTGDIYYKGANVLLMLRTIVNNDEKFRTMLIEMQKLFGKKTTNSADIERFINQYFEIDFNPLFQQYLYTNEIPFLKFNFNSNGSVTITTINCNETFSMPYRVPITATTFKTITLKANEPITVETTLKPKIFKKSILKGYYVGNVFE